MCLLAGRIAIFDELATIACLEAITTFTTSGAFLRVIGRGHDNIFTDGLVQFLAWR
jgi:hypothetical protein